MRKKLLIIVLIVLLSVFGYSGWQLYDIYHAYNVAEEEYAEIEKNYFTKKESDTKGSSDEKDLSPEKEDPDFDIDFVSLKSINEDTIAWIEVPSCNISYPLLQNSDIQYYLTHTFEKKSNHSGAIFLDSLNKPDFSDYNSVVYGHNMKNGSMFGRLKKLYQDKSLRKAYPYFYIILTDDTVLKYEIFSYYIGDETSKGYFIPQKEADFKEYINYCHSSSIEKIGTEVTVNDRIVTLATCSGAAGGTKRFFVHGVLRK